MNEISVCLGRKYFQIRQLLGALVVIGFAVLISACSGSVVQTTPVSTVEQPATLVADSTLASPTPEPTQVSTPTSVPTDTPVPPTATPAPPTPTKVPPTPEATATPEKPIATAKSAGNNLRMGPGTNYGVAGLTELGVAYEMTGYENDWWRLVDENGVEVWGWKDLFNAENVDQVEGVETKNIPPTPTAVPATPTTAPPTAEAPPPAPEVGSGNYVWGGNEETGQVDLLRRGGNLGIGNTEWVAPQRINSISFIASINGAELRYGSQLFVTGIVDTQPVMRGDHIYITIRHLDNPESKEELIVQRKLWAGVVLLTNVGGPISYYATDVAQIGPELFPVGSFFGMSIDANTGLPDGNRVLVVD